SVILPASLMPNKFLLAAFAPLCMFIGTAASPYALPMNSPPGPAITAVALQPAKTQLVQPCPAFLVFHGEITTTRATSVSYTWVDSRDKPWPVHHRRFSLAGVNGVAHKWKVGKPGKTVDYWVQLKIISPESLVSNKVPVHFTCAK